MITKTKMVATTSKAKSKSSNASVGSIQRRLLWLLGLSLPLLWFVISLLTALPLYQQINSDDDANLRRLALWLADNSHQGTLDDLDLSDFVTAMDAIDSELSEAEAMDNFISDIDEGLLDSFSFAVWNRQGQSIDSAGTLLPPYQATAAGFVNSGQPWQTDALRIFYHTDKRSGETIAVAQTWRDRLAFIWDTVIGQLMLLLLTLPLLLTVVIWAVRRGLHPLKTLANTLDTRHAHDLTPVSSAVPAELQPLTRALNQLLTRVSTTLAREQRFTADAAHELRSPLTAIKVQAHALAETLPATDATETKVETLHHLQRIQQVSDRASHLIDQLLTLARLDSQQQQTVATTAIDWLAVSDEALQSVNRYAREKHLRLRREVTVSAENILPLEGHAALMGLLLRNLLDNAIRYGAASSPKGNSESSSANNAVILTLNGDSITVRDNGQGIDSEYIHRVNERFFRPLGQTETGSGLGLSIVTRIAELHGLHFRLDNHPDGGVIATLQLSTNRNK